MLTIRPMVIWLNDIRIAHQHTPNFANETTTEQHKTRQETERIVISETQWLDFDIFHTDGC